MSDRKMRSELGCVMMLFTPIFLFGALVLANTSDDSMRTTDLVWSYVMFAVTALSLIAGFVLWARNHSSSGK